MQIEYQTITKDGKSVKEIKLRDDFWGACKAIMRAEFFDKTFLIAIIITISSVQWIRSKGDDLIVNIIDLTVIELDNYLQRKQLEKFDELIETEENRHHGPGIERLNTQEF